MADDQDTEKRHEPTQKKLQDARKKGELARSADLGVAAAYGGFLLGFAILGGSAVANVGTMLASLLGSADRFAALAFSQSATAFSGGVLLTIGQPAIAMFGLPATIVLLCFVAQRGLVFSGSRLKPRISRISPIANSKNKFGRSGLFEFSKSFAKLIIFSVLLWFYLLSRTDQIVGAMHLSAGGIAQQIGTLLLEFMAIVCCIALAIGAVDFLWQCHEHLRKNRMSDREMKEEHKSQEGDPQAKQERRQRGYAIAMNQMLNDIPGADVVIVNPEHYAVALKWDRLSRGAPVCVAKGVDHVAARIREAAREAGVAIQRDPPTARALFATVEIGQEILPEHYRAVAAAIRYADALRERVRAQNA